MAKGVVIINNEKAKEKSNICDFFEIPTLSIFISQRKERKYTTTINLSSAVNSSMAVFPSGFNNFSDVSAIKQVPGRLDGAVRIWDDPLFFPFS